MREGEAADVLGVRLVAAVGLDQVEHAVAAHVGDQRRVGGREVALVEDALAQPLRADLDAVHADGLEHRRDDHRAGEGDVGAVLLEPRQAAALGRRQLEHRVDQLLDAVAGELVAVQLVERVAGRALVHAREGADGAPDAHHPPAGAGQPVHAAQLLGDLAAQRLQVGAGGAEAGQVALGHPHRAQRARDRLLEAAPAHPGHLDAAAAQVEHVPVAEGGRVDRAEVAVPGLLLGREHPHAQGPVGRERPHRLLAVRGVAGGAGRHDGDVVHLGRLAEGRVEAGGVLGALQRVGAQARLVGALRDAHRVADLVDELERPPGPVAEYDQPEGVGPHVHDRQAALGGAAPRR